MERRCAGVMHAGVRVRRTRPVQGFLPAGRAFRLDDVRPGPELEDHRVRAVVDQPHRGLPPDPGPFEAEPAPFAK